MNSCLIDYTIAELELNLATADLPDSRAAIVEELGPSGERFMRVVEMHLEKANSKARRDLVTFETMLLDGKRFPEFTHWRLRLAGTVVRAAINAIPASGTPGPSKGLTGSLAYKLLSYSTSIVQRILEEAMIRTLRQRRWEFAAELASNSAWLRNRSRDIEEIPEAELVGAIARAINLEAPRLAKEYWAKQLTPKRGKPGLIAYAVRLLKMAKSELSSEALDAFFGDLTAAEAEDGRSIPLDAAAKSLAVQKSKKKQTP